MSRRKTDEQFRSYFWSRVDIRDPDECWNWKGSKTTCGGYGQIERDRKGLRANRMSYLFSHGWLPSSLQVLHKCDNPACCNPSHLFVGTPQDNMDDCRKKCRDRKALGSKNANAKLTEESVAVIRQRYACEEITTTELARIYGVTSSQISNAVRRVSWMHVP